jgi:hypothetical protein
MKKLILHSYLSIQFDQSHFVTLSFLTFHSYSVRMISLVLVVVIEKG